MLLTSPRFEWHQNLTLNLLVYIVKIISQNDQNYHLHLRDILLPPNIILVLGIQCSDQVVTVHHNVHKRIDETEECPVTTCNKKTIIWVFNFILKKSSIAGKLFCQMNEVTGFKQMNGGNAFAVRPPNNYAQKIDQDNAWPSGSTL